MVNGTQQRLIDELREAYIDKKRLTNRDFKYDFSKNSENHLFNASVICLKHEIDPIGYIALIYKYCPKKEYFGPSNLSGPTVAAFIAEFKSKLDEDPTLPTNDSLSYTTLWEHHLQLLEAYRKIGNGSLEEILLDPLLKFPAWFRVLCTDDANHRVISKYAAIANKELTPRVTDFITASKLHLQRITNHKVSSIDQERIQEDLAPGSVRDENSGISAQSPSKPPFAEKRIWTGFSAVDAVTDGLKLQELGLMVAHSGSGKTAMAVYSAIQNARAGRKVLFLSLEESKDDILSRLRSNLFRISYSDLHKNDELAEQRLTKSMADIDHATQTIFENIRVFDLRSNRGITCEQIAAFLDQIYQKSVWHPNVIYVDQMDYLGSKALYSEQWQKYNNISKEAQKLCRHRIGGKHHFAMWLLHQVAGGMRWTYTDQDISGFTGVIRPTDMVLALGRSCPASPVVNIFTLKCRHAPNVQFDYLADLEFTDFELIDRGEDMRFALAVKDAEQKRALEGSPSNAERNPPSPDGNGLTEEVDTGRPTSLEMPVPLSKSCESETNPQANNDGGKAKEKQDDGVRSFNKKLAYDIAKKRGVKTPDITAAFVFQTLCTWYNSRRSAFSGARVEGAVFRSYRKLQNALPWLSVAAIKQAAERLQAAFEGDFTIDTDATKETNFVITESLYDRYTSGSNKARLQGSVQLRARVCDLVKYGYAEAILIWHVLKKAQTFTDEQSSVAYRDEEDRVYVKLSRTALSQVPKSADTQTAKLPVLPFSREELRNAIARLKKEGVLMESSERDGYYHLKECSEEVTTN